MFWTLTCLVLFCWKKKYLFHFPRLHTAGIASRAIKPTLGIIDPLHTLSMPERIVANSGFDVLWWVFCVGCYLNVLQFCIFTVIVEKIQSRSRKELSSFFLLLLFLLGWSPLHFLLYFTASFRIYGNKSLICRNFNVFEVHWRNCLLPGWLLSEKRVQKSLFKRSCRWLITIATAFSMSHRYGREQRTRIF